MLKLKRKCKKENNPNIQQISFLGLVKKKGYEPDYRHLVMSICKLDVNDVSEYVHNCV